MCRSLSSAVASVARRMDEIPRFGLERGACAVVVAIAATVTCSVFAPIVRPTGDRSVNKEAVG